MSNTMCHELQPCLETQILEPQTLGLKMVLQPMSRAKRSPMSYLGEINDKNNNNNITNDNNNKDKGGDVGGMSFIQALTNSSSLKEDKEKHYVHPLVKQYSSRLSEKSLELCTETLGCETGSNYTDIDMFYLSSSTPTAKAQTKVQYSSGCRKTNYGSFPPPLTSISGSNCVNIMPHREGGRLVMKAVIVPSTNSCFQAERSDGRLTLRLLDNHESSHFDSEVIEERNERQQEHKEEEEEEEEQEQEQEQEYVHEDVHEHKHQDQHAHDQTEKLEDDYLEEEIEGVNEKNKVEMEMMGKIQRPRRCKEGGRGNNRLLKWK